MNNAITVTRKVLAIYTIVLILVGTILCLISTFICFKLRKNNTFIYLAFFSMANIFTLYYWNIRNFLQLFFDTQWQSAPFIFCKLGDYIQFTSLPISAWILVFSSFEQYLSVRIKSWRMRYMSPKKVYIIISSLIAFFLLINANAFFYNGVNVNVNGTWVYVCSNSDWFVIWGYIHLVLYSLAPFAFLFVINTLLCVHVYKSARRVRSRKNSSVLPGSNKHLVNSNASKRALNKTIIVSTVMFIVMTLPTAISSFFFVEWYQTDIGNFLINLFDDLSFTYHGLNFFILILFNKRFRGCVKKIIFLEN